MPWNEPGIIGKVLDGGAWGVICPMVNNATEAKALDSYALYPPKGKLSNGPIRAGAYGDATPYQATANDEVLVIAPIEGSPAARAGIRPGDTIVGIDDAPVRGNSTRELIQKMRGAAGTKVKLTIRRQGEVNLRQFVLAREVIEVASVSHKALDGAIAYIRVKQFQSGTHTELLEAIGTLREETGTRIAAQCA